MDNEEKKNDEADIVKVTVQQARAWVLAKDAMEEEMEAIEAELRGSGVGLRGGLVDDEGYPIGDVEKILRTRQLRNRLACLKTDHSVIMAKIESGIVALHTEAKKHHSPSTPSSSSSPSSSSPSSSSPSSDEMNVSAHNSVEGNSASVHQHDTPIQPLLPLCFAKSVKAGTPAHTAGVLPNDAFLQIGRLTSSHTAHMSDDDALKCVRDVVCAHSGDTLSVRVRRSGEEKEMVVRVGRPPVLGCHLVRTLEG